MLRVRDLHAWYGASHVLQGVDLDVRAGEIVCLLGRNGAGKTTTLKAIMGLVDRHAGGVAFDGRAILATPAYTRHGLGLAYVPEDRRIVPGLSVRDNLRLGLVACRGRRDDAAMITRTAAIFPRLAERLDQVATTLSGGEQQMLAVARAMLAGPKMMMLDEPTEGIMPILVDELFDLFARLRGEGMAILLVEQNVTMALGLADRAYVLDQGTIVHQASAASLLADQAIQERYCAV